MKRRDEEEEAPDTFDAVIEAIDRMESEPDRHLSIQIDRSLRDAIRAAQTSGQKASITIALFVTSRPDDPRRVNFVAKVAAKLPRPPVSSVSLYADEEGGVHNHDPAQLKLPYAPIPISQQRKE